MDVAAIAFYVFSAVAVGAAALVVISKNPVHSVLWLITVFASCAGLFVLSGAEFVAMLLIIVYVGAVMVLFLFVVMMIDVDFAKLRAGFAKFLPLGAVIGLVLLVELVLVIGVWTFGETALESRAAVAPALEDVSNTRALGRLIYTDYVLLFQASGLVLFVAMVGAIVLTHRRRVGIKRQDVLAQMYRDRAQSVELKNVKPGQGV